MKCSFLTNVNFQARPVKHISVGKLAPKSHTGYLPVSGYIVEINKAQRSDRVAISDAVSEWGEEARYGMVIVDNAKKSSPHIKSKYNRNKIYALTLQQNNFQTLESDKILGLSEVTQLDKNKVEINFLQVKPTSAGRSKKKEYINVGKNFIEMLKKNPANTTIFVKAAYSAANFYEKMKFKIMNTENLIYVWEKSKELTAVLKHSAKGRLKHR